MPEKYLKYGEALESNATPADTLYHYTSKDGLTGILSTQQLWLTHYSSLNDTTEMLHALEIISKFISQIASDKIFRIFWKNLFEDIRDIITDELDFFVGSFCVRKDYLHAWKNYGDDRKGFSIGFKKEFFKGTSATPTSQDLEPSFCRGRVIYDFNKLKNQIKRLCKTVQEDLKNQNGLHNIDEAVEKRMRIARLFCATLSPFLSLIKSPEYKKEREHRIYCTTSKVDFTQKFSSLTGKSTRSKLDRINRVCYNFSLEYINEIWVGPGLNFEKAKNYINEIIIPLKEKGRLSGEIEILHSKIPYKNHLNELT